MATKEVYDGFTVLLGGMNAGFDAGVGLSVTENTYALGINVTSRSGLIHTRPGFTKFVDVAGSVFQGAGRWSLESGDHLVLVVDGSTIVIDCDTGAQTTSATGLDTSMQCFGCQPDRWYMLLDGSSRPVVLEWVSGVLEVSRNPTDATPVCLVPGLICAYAHGRIHYTPLLIPDMADTDGDGIPDLMAEPGQMTFVSGDVRDVTHPEYLFKMLEHVDLSEGGALALPIEIGYITGIQPMRNAASGTGVGALIVFGREGVAAFDVSIPRDQWHSYETFGQMLFVGAGTHSPWSIVAVNGDLMFLGTDGHIRALKHTISELRGDSSSTSLSNTPMSFELTPYVSTVNRSQASAAFVDNRYVCTFRGVGDHFTALASLDFAPAYTINLSPSKMYDGFMTGFRIKQVVAARRSGDMVLFLVVEKDGGGFSIYRMDPAAVYDAGTTPIESILVTRKYNFSLLNDVKVLKYVELEVGDLVHDVTLEVKFRADGYPNWTSLGAKLLQVPGGAAQYRRRIRFAVDEDSVLCQDTNNEKLYVGARFQFLIKATGYYKLEKCRMVANGLQEAPPVCESDNSADSAFTAGETVDYFEYEVPT